jgi:hypothetical protein
MPDSKDFQTTSFFDSPAPKVARGRRYFSARTAPGHDVLKLDLPILKRLFLVVYEQLEREGYFQESLGDFLH